MFEITTGIIEAFGKVISNGIDATTGLLILVAIFVVGYAVISQVKKVALKLLK